MAKDFRASQIETTKLIASGGLTKNVGLAIYSCSVASNKAGGVKDSAMFSKIGTDVFMFVSGTATKTGTGRSNITLFGGDVVISGTLWAERQVIEVDSVADGDFFVTGNLYVEPDTNSTTSVSFRNAAGTSIFNVDSTNKRIGIGDVSPDALLDIQGESGTGVPSLRIDHDDTDKVAIQVAAANIDADVLNITADAVTTAKVIDISADALSTGNAIYVDDASTSTSTRNTVEIIQNAPAAIAATALKVQSDGGITGIALDKNFAGGTAATITGLSIDLDKTVATTSNNTMYGINVDADNTTATNGTNTMVGLNVTPTLTHAADAGTPTVKGAVITATGGTNGTSVSTGAEITATGADTNTGILINCADGGTDLKIVSSADTADYFTIAVAGSGATTMTTVDGGAAAANLQITADGTFEVDATTITLDSTGDITLDAAGNDILLKDAGTEFAKFSNLASSLVVSASVTDKDIIFKASTGGSSVEIARFDGSASSLLMASSKKIELGATQEYIYGDGTDIHLGVGSGGDINIPADIGLTFGDDGEKIEGDGTSLTIAGGNITLDSEGDIVLDAAGNDILLKDAGTEFAKFSNVASSLVISASIPAKDIIFKGQNTAAATTEFARFDSSASSFLMASTNKIQFTDTNAYINHDGTDLQIVDDADINIKPAVHFLVDAGGGIIFDADGAAGISFKDGGTQYLLLSQSAGNAILSSSVDTKDIIFHGDDATEVCRIDGDAKSLLVASSKKIELGHADEHIYGDGTDIHFGVGSSGDINIPSDIGLTFGNDGEKIEGNGTYLTIAGGAIVLDSEGDITLDAAGNDIFLKDAGTEFAKFSNLASSLVISSSITDKDIILKGSTGGSSVEIARFDSSQSSFLMGSDRKIQFGGQNTYLVSDNYSLTGSSTGEIMLDSTGGQIFKSKNKIVARAAAEPITGVTNASGSFSHIRPFIVCNSNTTLYNGDSGAVVFFNAQNVTITLPDSRLTKNLGCWFTFVNNNNTAGDKFIDCANGATEFFTGFLPSFDTDTSNTVTNWLATPPNGYDRITLNGTTTGIVGSRFTMIAVQANEWSIIGGQLFHTADSATPFSSEA